MNLGQSMWDSEVSGPVVFFLFLDEKMEERTNLKNTFFKFLLQFSKSKIK